MPRLKCTFREFIEIIGREGFVLHREGKGSHSIYRRERNGEAFLVTVAAHKMSDDIQPGTLNAMIRQAGLPKDLFLK